MVVVVSHEYVVGSCLLKHPSWTGMLVLTSLSLILHVSEKCWTAIKTCSDEETQQWGNFTKECYEQYERE